MNGVCFPGITISSRCDGMMYLIVCIYFVVVSCFMTAHFVNEEGGGVYRRDNVIIRRIHSNHFD